MSLFDRRLKRRMADIKASLYHLSARSKNCSLPCFSRFQKSLARRRVLLVCRFKLLEMQLEKPHKFKQQTLIDDV